MGDADLVGEVLRLTRTPQRPALPRHRHGLTREQIVTAQRARIIVATAEVVTERGYAGAPVRAIIERAGVSSKTFYELYDDKEQAFLAAFTLLDDVVVAVVSELPRRFEHPRQALRAGLAQFLDTLAAWPLFTRLHAVEARAAGHRALEHRTAIFWVLVRGLSGALTAAAARDPRVDPPNEVVLMGVVGGIGELVLQHVVRDGAETLPVLLDDVVELVERVCLRR